jgi:DNA-binding NtrC family response regulator
MKNILVIEDDGYVQKMLRQTLERAGYYVETADNGRAGLELYYDKNFDLVITDLIMPEMEGIETISLMRKKNPEVKVIAISGGGRNKPEDYLYLAEKLGASRTFPKPVDRDALLGAISDLIDTDAS